MKRKIKRLWKLYQELRRLRKVNPKIVRDCNEANDKLAVTECARLRMENYARSLEEKLRKRGNRVDFCVPNVSAIVSPYAMNETAEQARATYVEKELTDHMKINLVDSLIKAGWLKKTQLNNYETIYSLWLVEE
jgi:hypothetical protein